MTLWVALVVLVAFSAFFSASETAFSSLNQIRLKSRAEDGDTSAARVLAMAEKYDKLLSTILIGNNIVNIAAASIGTIIFTKMLGAERGATVSTMVLTVVVLIFGEVTPKSLAKEMPETVATAVAPALSLLLLVFTPLTWLFSQWKRLLGHFVHSTEEDTITEGELMTMVSEAENDGELTDRESELIRRAIEFDDVEVEEILTPRVDVIAVEDDMPLEEVAQTFAESGYSRLPVYHDTIDNIIGVVHEKDFYMARLKKEVKLEELVRAVCPWCTARWISARATAWRSKFSKANTTATRSFSNAFSARPRPPASCRTTTWSTSWMWAWRGNTATWCWNTSTATP